MRIKVIENQTIFDIAKQHYGNIEAVFEILGLNPNICNKLHEEFEIDKPVMVDLWLEIDNKSRLKNGNVIRNIKNDITLYNNENI